MLNHGISWWLVRHRLFEWTMTFMLLAVGTHLTLWPNSVESSSFYRMLNMVSPHTAAMVLIMAGILRFTALLVNGRWPQWGPRLRAIGSISGAIIWIQMSIALLQLYPGMQKYPSPGITVYAVLALFEFISIRRAAADVRPV